MKQTDVLKERALKSWQRMNQELAYRVLVEKSISESSTGTFLEPMQKMDWETMEKYCAELESILKTSKTEAEVIQKAEEARANL